MKALTRALAALALSIAAVQPVAAEGRYHRGDDGVEGSVTATSRFGNTKVSGPVRMTPLGPQVRLPGGNWEYCKRSCSETLRAETVDYWEAHGPNSVAEECGIFGCLEVHYPR